VAGTTTACRTAATTRCGTCPTGSTAGASRPATARPRARRQASSCPNRSKWLTRPSKQCNPSQTQARAANARAGFGSRSRLVVDQLRVGWSNTGAARYRLGRLPRQRFNLRRIMALDSGIGDGSSLIPIQGEPLVQLDNDAPYWFLHPLFESLREETG